MTTPSAQNVSDIMDEEELQLLYTYIDTIPLSRPKKNIAHDFSDGVLMAEVVKHYYPKLVELHNYSAANAVSKKLYNWNTLNQKVLKKIKFPLTTEEIDAIVKCQPGAIERLLRRFQVKIAQLQAEGFDPTIVVGREQKIAKNENSKNVSPRSNMGAPSVQVNLPTAGSGGASKQITVKAPQGVAKLPANAARGHSNMNLIDGLSIEDDSDSNAQPPGTYYNASRKDGWSVEERMAEKDAKISELTETVKLLETKVNKLNLLLRLKESKINALTQKLKENNLLK